jgi:predicted RNA-binding protein with PIN domain
MQYIIDGYNLLHQTDFEERDELIESIVNFCGVCNKNAKMVFDGHANEEHPSTRVHVIFAGDADAEIIRILEEVGTPSFYTLISSDKELKLVARKRKVKVVNSEDFDFSIPEKGATEEKEVCFMDDEDVEKQLKEFNNFKS